MSLNLHAIRLGATLYMPATRQDLHEVIAGRAIPDLRSMVICLEDAVSESDVPRAMVQLARTIGSVQMQIERKIQVFVRPRSPSMLARILRMRGISLIDGFVLPKITPATFPQWMEAMGNSTHRLMPTLETGEAFDQSEMKRLRDQFGAVSDRITALRIGGNDLLSVLGVRRSRTRTIHDGPLGPVLSMLAGTFMTHGYAMSSPVMEMYSDLELLQEEVERDVEHGFLAKTAIHPKQIPIIQAAYAISPGDLNDARQIMAADAPAVFGSNGAMCEPQTHRNWAIMAIERTKYHGVRSDAPVALQSVA